MRRNRRAKIIATLGPASSRPEMIRRLFDAGADVFRINMSHASHEDLRERHAQIRAIERETDHPIGILCDLQGPKLRVGQFAQAVELTAGQSFSFDKSEEPGTHARVFLPHPEIFEAIKPGDHLLLNDGKLRLVTTAHTP